MDLYDDDLGMSNIFNIILDIKHPLRCDIEKMGNGRHISPPAKFRPETTN